MKATRLLFFFQYLSAMGYLAYLFFSSFERNDYIVSIKKTEMDLQRVNIHSGTFALKK
jgi:hypothetical protein